jgi:hypothetical protein
MDLTLGSSPYMWTLAPSILGAGATSAAFISVSNDAPTSLAITVTLQYVVIVP